MEIRFQLGKHVYLLSFGKLTLWFNQGSSFFSLSEEWYDNKMKLIKGEDIFYI
jgi:hypothetical protein